MCRWVWRQKNLRRAEGSIQSEWIKILGMGRDLVSHGEWRQKSNGCEPRRKHLAFQVRGWPHPRKKTLSQILHQPHPPVVVIHVEDAYLQQFQNSLLSSHRPQCWWSSGPKKRRMHWYDIIYRDKTILSAVNHTSKRNSDNSVNRSARLNVGTVTNNMRDSCI